MMEPRRGTSSSELFRFEVFEVDGIRSECIGTFPQLLDFNLRLPKIVINLLTSTISGMFSTTTSSGVKSTAKVFEALHFGSLRTDFTFNAWLPSIWKVPQIAFGLVAFAIIAFAF